MPALSLNSFSNSQFEAVGNEWVLDEDRRWTKTAAQGRQQLGPDEQAWTGSSPTEYRDQTKQCRWALLAPAAFEGARLFYSAPSPTRIMSIFLRFSAQKTAGTTRLDASNPAGSDCGPFQIFSLNSARAPKAADPRKQGRFIGSPAAGLCARPLSFICRLRAPDSVVHNRSRSPTQSPL